MLIDVADEFRTETKTGKERVKKFVSFSNHSPDCVEIRDDNGDVAFRIAPGERFIISLDDARDHLILPVGPGYDWLILEE